MYDAKQIACMDKDVVFLLLRLLSEPGDLAAAACCCTAWRDALAQDALWQSVYEDSIDGSRDECERVGRWACKTAHLTFANRGSTLTHATASKSSSNGLGPFGGLLVPCCGRRL